MFLQPEKGVVWNRKQAEERTGFMVLEDAVALSWDSLELPRIVHVFLAMCQLPKRLAGLRTADLSG